MLKKFYRYIFWIGYSVVFLTAFIPIAGDLTKISLGPPSFHIRLDHLLHIIAYFLICIYFLFGRRKGLELFDARPLQKFVTVTLFLATVTEFVQLFVPERAFNLFDWVAGVVVGVVVIIGTRNWRNGTSRE